MKLELTVLVALAAFGTALIFGGLRMNNRIALASKYTIERAYFEGQRDALAGDIRIEFDEGFGVWRWTKSPWDNGDLPVTLK